MKYDIEKRKTEARARYELRLKQVSPERVEILKQDYGLLMRVLDLLTDKTAQAVSEITGVGRTVIYAWGKCEFPRSFQLHPEADCEQIAARQKELHRIYDAQISSADGRKIDMQRDLADFDRAASLLLDHYSYREALRLMGARFRKVYGWIKGKGLPLSFRNSATRTKEIPAGLRERQQFAYLLGVYQSKVDEIPPERLSITTRDSGLERTIRQSMDALGLKYSQVTVHYAGRAAERIYYDSKSLMSMIKEITEDNTSIPREFMQDQKMLIRYLQGFFDSRAVPSYAPNTIQSSHIRRVHPRIIITKSNSTSLMSAVNTALHSLGINSRYNPHKDPIQIEINDIASIRRVLDYGLFKNKEKLRALTETYRYWRETKEYDHNGKFQKLKDKIREERDKK